MLFASAVLDLVSTVLSQENGLEVRLRDDLFCVVERKTLTPSILFALAAV